MNSQRIKKVQNVFVLHVTTWMTAAFWLPTLWLLVLLTAKATVWSRTLYLLLMILKESPRIHCLLKLFDVFLKRKGRWSLFLFEFCALLTDLQEKLSIYVFNFQTFLQLDRPS